MLPTGHSGNTGGSLNDVSGPCDSYLRVGKSESNPVTSPWFVFQLNQGPDHDWSLAWIRLAPVIGTSMLAQFPTSKPVIRSVAFQHPEEPPLLSQTHSLGKLFREPATRLACFRSVPLIHCVISLVRSVCTWTSKTENWFVFRPKEHH